jgi:hypothetical protein
VKNVWKPTFKHSLCPYWDLGLEHMKTMQEEINLKDKESGLNNTLLN